jgi:hypothetical protein
MMKGNEYPILIGDSSDEELEGEWWDYDDEDEPVRSGDKPSRSGDEPVRPVPRTIVFKPKATTDDLELQGLLLHWYLFLIFCRSRTKEAKPQIQYRIGKADFTRLEELDKLLWSLLTLIEWLAAFVQKKRKGGQSKMRYDVAKLSADHLDKAQVRYN